MQAWDESMGFKIVHGKLILYLSSDSRVLWKGAKLGKFLPLSFLAFLQEIQSVSYHETVMHHSNSLEKTIWRVSRSVLWSPKRMTKTLDYFFMFYKMSTHTLTPKHSVMEASTSISTDRKDWNYLFLQIRVRSFCITKHFFFLILQVQIKISVKSYGH